MNDTNLSYDYVIIGGGPSGLALSYLLALRKKKCIIIEKEPFLGGCHRVYRLNGYFTEHSPRIYSSTYINTINMLKLMGKEFEDLFTPYNFSISNIGGNVLSHLSIKEIVFIIIEFGKFIANNSTGECISMLSFMNDNSFSDSAKDYIDRLCRLSDGSDSSKYSVNKFLQIINQQSVYKLYQPKQPTDIGLINIFEQACIQTGYVTILKSTTIEKLIYNEESNLITEVVSNQNKKITGKYVVLAIPPKSLYSLLLSSNLLGTNSKSIFKNVPDLKDWVSKSSYNTYIAITFHWKDEITLYKDPSKKVWGFPKSEWGVAFIVLSDYMNSIENNYRTVISTCITIFDKDYKGKIPQTVIDETELKTLVFEQLKQSFPNLPDPSFSILSPTVTRYEDGTWVEADTGFIKTYNNSYIPFQTTINNLLNVGTQNGTSEYKFTSFESAICNAIHLSYYLEPSCNQLIKYERVLTLRDYILRGIIIIIIIFVLLVVLKYFKNI